jgi:DNA invertase Pin-like site-specific DNA recombinase
VNALGYVRVSTGGQERNGYSIKAQRAAIQADVARRGWKLVRIAEETGSGKSMKQRPVLKALLGELDAGDALVVAKLDRLSRSCVDFGTILAGAQKKGWTLVALDLGVDTSTAGGELLANVMISVAQWERRAIGERTRDALAAAKAKGVRLGRPPTMDPKVRTRIRALRKRGHSLRTIAERLNAENVPTAQGGRRWHAETIRQVLGE